MYVDISKTEPTKVFVVLHRFKGAIIGTAGGEVFPDKEKAEAYIQHRFANDPALDYKDSFLIREVVVDESVDSIKRKENWYD
jgi:hypothetical protein